MILKSLELKNFRLFSDFTMDFHPELTVIVAPNGGGKTAILDAIKISIGPFLSVFPTGKGCGIENEDIHLVETLPELGRMATVLPVSIKVRGRFKSTVNLGRSWKREKSTEKGRTTVKDARSLSNFGSGLKSRESQTEIFENWPVLAYYGTGRLWNQLKLTDKKLFKSGFYSRAAGYIDCMQPASSYKLFLDWFGYATRAENQAKIQYIEANPRATAAQITESTGSFAVLLRAVRNTVNIVLEPVQWGDLTFSETLRTATIKHPEHGVLEVDQMSDGIRNLLALAADLAWRCVQLNAHLGDKSVTETEGVVLIDEVDMHLHPEWQQLVLGSLRKAFPKIQFIVTTHSPQVLTSVHRECIRVLKISDGQVFVATPVHETYGQESRTALEDVLGVASRPPLEINLKLQEYLKLVETGNDATSTALALRKELEQSLGSGDPQLQLADMMVARNVARRRGRQK